MPSPLPTYYKFTGPAIALPFYAKYVAASDSGSQGANGATDGSITLYDDNGDGTSTQVGSLTGLTYSVQMALWADTQRLMALYDPSYTMSSVTAIPAPTSPE